MSDQCKHCLVRGDIKVCKETECRQHESWYAQEIQAELTHIREALKKMEREKPDFAQVHEVDGPTVEQLVIRHGFDMEITKHVLRRLNADLSRMCRVWHKPGKEISVVAESQINELRAALKWLSNFYSKHWPDRNG